MLLVDYAIIGIIAVSAIIGLTRGLVREVVSLAVWGAALAAAWFFYQPLALQLSPWISTPMVRIGVAVLILVFGVLIVGAILAYLITLLIDKTGLSGTDRVLGLVFGAARGAVLVALLVFLGSLTPITNETWWQDASLLTQFKDLAQWLLDQVPPDVTARIRTI